MTHWCNTKIEKVITTIQNMKYFIYMYWVCVSCKISIYFFKGWYIDAHQNIYTYFRFSIEYQKKKQGFEPL